METPEGWEVIDGALQRELRFRDFAGAIDFVNRLAEEAERAGHHPDLAIHWNHVTVRWWTHSEQAVTERDAEMARRTDAIA